MKRALLALAAALLAGGAFADAPCPAADDVTPQLLVGTWQADLQGSWNGAILQLGANPDYPGSLRGTLEREGQHLQVAGDLDEDGFTLEESADGQHIAATWLGDVAEGSCGREIRGTWTRDGETASRAFVLRKR
ncbi:hypothetical protein JJB11_08380 [Ramlibacter ginsenosidimutans]|uniref:Uncharacterized protein n=1 Tax=Ramlibacter ginsenosidimutans TaxID=502333 RepID=A0A934WLZ6_9BURK|nr:hypothetical protein [Ramlibacter ginsenosidimutans]MBK6006111.1 hypothetical protein [Ramlibacter ginsenosidimutans]